MNEGGFFQEKRRKVPKKKEAPFKESHQGRGRKEVEVCWGVPEHLRAELAGAGNYL